MKPSALTDELPVPPNPNNSSGLPQQPQVIARQIKPQGGDDDDLLLLDDEDSPDTPDGGPTAGVPAPPEQPHPIPPDIPDMLHLYPTRQHCPPDCYS